MLPQNIYCLKPLALICSLLSLKVVFSTHELNSISQFFHKPLYIAKFWELVKVRKL